MNHIYFFYDTNKNLLYVGKTTALPKRMSAHFSPNTVENEPWKRSVDQNTIVTFRCTTQTDLDIYETYFINKYKPLYNKDKVFYDLPTFELPELKSHIYVYSPYKKTKDSGISYAFFNYVNLRDKKDKTSGDIELISKIESEYSNFSKDYLTDKKENILMENEIIEILNSQPERIRIAFADCMSFTNTYSKFDKFTKRFVWK